MSSIDKILDEVLAWDPVRECRAEPRKIRERRKHFIKVPMVWDERLLKAHRITTCHVARHLLYLHWKNRGEPFTLANGALTEKGIERRAKWRALLELEQLGLITIGRRPHKSPVITVHVDGKP